MKIIWTDTIVEESNLAHYLHVLRKTLGQKNDGQSFIETLRRRGYRFTPHVRVTSDSEPQWKAKRTGGFECCSIHGSR